MHEEQIKAWNINCAATLCSCLWQNDIIDTCIQDGVNDSSFFRIQHKEMWRIMSEMRTAGKEVDIVTMAEPCINAKIEVWELNEISSATEVFSHAKQYVERIKEYARLKKLERMAHEILEGVEGAHESSAIISDSQKHIEGLDSTEKSLMKADEFIQLGYDYLTKKDKEADGKPFGFRELDAVVKGLKKARLYILAARPSLGKSSLALNVADNATEEIDEPVALFSLEMQADELGARMIVAKSERAEDKIRLYANAAIMNDVNRAAAILRERKIFVDDSTDISVQQIQARARKIKNRHGLGLIIVDYLQLVAPERGSRNQTREQQVSSISRDLKKMAGNLGVPVLCLSQLSRASEQQCRKPRLSDLRESGAIEQDADVVILLHQDEAMKENEHVQAIVAKQRGGATGEVDLSFKKYWTKFKDFAGSYASEGVKPNREDEGTKQKPRKSNVEVF